MATAATTRAPRFRVAVDIGGTFTDIVFLDAGGRLHVKKVSSSVEDYARAIAVHPEGLIVYVTGESTAVGTGSDYATIAYEALTGLPLWTARYDGPASNFDAAHSIAVSDDGLTAHLVYSGNDHFSVRQARFVLAAP